MFVKKNFTRLCIPALMELQHDEAQESIPGLDEMTEFLHADVLRLTINPLA